MWRNHICNAKSPIWEISTILFRGMGWKAENTTHNTTPALPDKLSLVYSSHTQLIYPFSSPSIIQ